MSKTNYKIEQVFNNTNTTFEELLVKAINTYISNKENTLFMEKTGHFQDKKLKCK